jgi:type IV pilus assembly protein PilA
MRKRVQKGFTLVELMLIVGIIGIMAAIALPTYQNFTVRTKVSELLLTASSFKMAVAEKAQDDGALASAGVGLTVVPSGKVSGGSVTNDGIVTVSGNAATLGVAVTITLTPSRGLDGKVVWVCSTAAATFKYVPKQCQN